MSEEPGGPGWGADDDTRDHPRDTTFSRIATKVQTVYPTHTKTSETSTTTIEPKEIALGIVGVLCLVLFVMAIFIDSMREGLNGALPYLLGILAVAAVGFPVFRFFKSDAGA